LAQRIADLEKRVAALEARQQLSATGHWPTSSAVTMSANGLERRLIRLEERQTEKEDRDG
jgi:phage shock protein A